MNKTKKVALSLIASVLSLGGLSMLVTGCGPEEAIDYFTFSIALESGKTSLELGVPDKLIINATGTCDKDGNKIEKFNYEFKVNNSTICEINKTTGEITPVGVGSVTFTVEETNTRTRANLTNVAIANTSEPATGGFNYSNLTDDTRTEILGSLEKYAMDSHLTGITLFENGGYVKYHERIEMPTTDYITGYGFGILSEGNITAPLATETIDAYKMYYHTAISQDPIKINAMNASGSQVSDLAGYITSTYWGNKMNADKDGYDWYPVLAKDKVGGKDYNRPTPVDRNGVVEGASGFISNATGLYDTWRIYVKTGSELTYRTNSSARSAFDGRAVELKDYETPIKVMLTGAAAQSRGAEMAGDTTYGIKGAQSFYNKSKKFTTTEEVNTLWNQSIADGELGIKTGNDSIGGDYIQFSILNEIDAFTAMYTLSSSLYSPMPESFLTAISKDGSIINGIQRYGQPNENTEKDAILDFTICCGTYYLESWEEKQAIIFKRNDDWFERKANPNRYNIEGILMRVIDTAQDEQAVWKEFDKGNLDSAGVPTKQLKTQIGQPHVYQTKGDSTFKLNVNACTQDRWDYLFGSSGKINKGSNWEVKPWMSNDNFLKGLFHAINRKEFAEKRGVQPSINYFSDSYLSDPEKGISYNSTEAHKKAVNNYQVKTKVGDQEVDMYGYSLDLAVGYFKTAVNELVKSGAIKKGTSSNPKEINIHIRWMYQTDISEYGADIAKYFEDAFNDSAVSNGTVKLVVEQDAVTNWEEVYNEWMMKGQFDLGFGAISGNTYNPLNFMEVLKSDNSSGFTLNWGADTGIVDPIRPLVFDGKKWSFDALWEVADHGGVVENGEIIKPVKACYMENPKTLDGTANNPNIYTGAKITIPVTFADVGDSAQFEVTNVRIYLVGVGSFNLDYEFKDGKVIITLDGAKASQYNDQLVEANKLIKEDPSQADQNIPYPLVLGYYNTYWNIEVYYTIKIGNGNPTQNVINAAKDKEAWEADNAK